MEWAPVAKGSTNYALRVTNCRIMNDIVSKASKFRMNFRYKGKGSLLFYVYRYGPKNKNRPSRIIYKMDKVDAKDWTNGRFEFKNPAIDDKERQVFALHAYGDFTFDEIYLSPIAK